MTIIYCSSLNETFTSDYRFKYLITLYLHLLYNHYFYFLKIFSIAITFSFYSHLLPLLRHLPLYHLHLQYRLHFHHHRNRDFHILSLRLFIFFLSLLNFFFRSFHYLHHLANLLFHLHLLILLPNISLKETFTFW
jgi:hypothetical protein